MLPTAASSIILAASHGARARTPLFAEEETNGQSGAGHTLESGRAWMAAQGWVTAAEGRPGLPTQEARTGTGRERSSRVSWLGPASSQCLGVATAAAQRARPGGLETLCTDGKAEAPSQACALPPHITFASSHHTPFSLPAPRPPCAEGPLPTRPQSLA